MISRLRAVPASDVHLALMLCLTFTTGINDAVGYLGLDKVFTGNMTGNVVILGMALTGDTNLPVLGPALALAGFMLGAAISGRVLKRQAASAWGRGTTWLLAVVAAMMVAGAGALVLAGEGQSLAVTVSVTTVAALAMGLQAAAARQLAVKEVTTVVVTSTITGLAADSRWGAGKPGATGRRVAAIVLILLGALLGALLVQADPALGLLVAGVLIAAVAVVGAVHASGTPVDAAERSVDPLTRTT